MKYMRAEKKESIVAEEHSEDAWAETVLNIASSSLLPGTKSVSRSNFSIRSHKTDFGSGTWATTFLEKRESL
jgi:hypothetical protein